MKSHSEMFVSSSIVIVIYHCRNGVSPVVVGLSGGVVRAAIGEVESSLSW